MMSLPAAISLRQLRLAVVCDGGVSLAIYMHGVTKELHKLVRASREFDAVYGNDPPGIGSAPNPFDQTEDTEFAYFEELRDLAIAGRPVSVVIDVISGTSAGGINGVCLAKVLAGGGQQDALRNLWMTKGDMRQLLVGPQLPWLRLQIAVSLLRVLVGLMRGRSTYPLHGDRMARWLFDAITEMEGKAGASLVPAGNSLELFVTNTDLDGFDVLVPAGGGGPSQHAVDHRQVLTFRYQKDGQNDFVPGNTGALAFAARATSAFPAAFPPVTINGFVEDLSGDGHLRPCTAASVVDRLRWQHPSPQSTTTAPCVDGGVLDNQPFDLVIDAIAGKRAETEVLRRLIYIEPVPGGALVPPPAQPAPPQRPHGLLQDVKAALVNARGDQPVLTELLHLRDINLRIGQIGDIVLQEMTDVLGSLAEAVQTADAGSLSDLDQHGVGVLTTAMHGQAFHRLGPMYATYCRLKLAAAADEIADQIDVRFSYPPGSNNSSFARAVIHAWFHRQPGWATGSQELIDLLDQVDVPYRVRRLQFILAGISGLYSLARTEAPGTPSVQQLNSLKTAAWDLLDEIRAQTAETVRTLPAGTAEFLDKGALTDAVVLTDPAVFAEKFGPQIAAMISAYGEGMAPTVTGMGVRMWSTFTEQTGDWDAKARDELVSRYVAFPLWDALIFPTIALSPVPQFTPIGVTRFSPLDAHRLDALGPKLKGVAVHHFGGFLDVKFRENDYLWGRLDGAELCLGALRAGANDLPSGIHGDAGSHLDGALLAAVKSENDLDHIPQLRSEVLARLQSQPSTPGPDSAKPELSPLVP